MSEIGNVTAENFVTFMLFYVLAHVKMDPKGRLSSQIHFLVPSIRKILTKTSFFTHCKYYG